MGLRRLTKRIKRVVKAPAKIIKGSFTGRLNVKEALATSLISPTIAGVTNPRELTIAGGALAVGSFFAGASASAGTGATVTGAGAATATAGAGLAATAGTAGAAGAGTAATVAGAGAATATAGAGLAGAAGSAGAAAIVSSATIKKSTEFALDTAILAKSADAKRKAAEQSVDGQPPAQSQPEVSTTVLIAGGTVLLAMLLVFKK